MLLAAWPATADEAADEDVMTKGLRELVPELPAAIDRAKGRVQDFKDWVAEQPERVRRSFEPSVDADAAGDRPVAGGTTYRGGAPRTLAPVEPTIDRTEVTPRRDPTVRLRVDRDDIAARDGSLVARDRELAAEEERCAREPGTRGCGWDLDRAKEKLADDRERLLKEKRAWNAELGKNTISAPFRPIEELASKGRRTAAEGTMLGGEAKTPRERCADLARHYQQAAASGNQTSAQMTQRVYHDACRSAEERQLLDGADADAAEARFAGRKSEIASKQAARNAAAASAASRQAAPGWAEPEAAGPDGWAVLGGIVAGTAMQALSDAAQRRQGSGGGRSASGPAQGTSAVQSPARPRCRQRELACGTPGGCGNLPVCPLGGG